jgi:hypothetical protein
MHFGMKSYLKSTRNHTAKHTQKKKKFAMKNGVNAREYTVKLQ